MYTSLKQESKRREAIGITHLRTKTLLSLYFSLDSAPNSAESSESSPHHT